MNSLLASPRILRTLLVIAAGFVAFAFAVWSPERGIATLVGASLSVLNWWALVWLGARIVDGGEAVAAERAAHALASEAAASEASAASASAPVAQADSGGARKALIGALLVGKIGLLMGLVYVLIHRVKLDPIGLAFGLGVLFVGPVAAALVASVARPLSPSAAGAAREER